jgi:hypothetical protein
MLCAGVGSECVGRGDVADFAAKSAEFGDA